MCIRDRPRMSPSLPSIATSTKLRMPIRDDACAQLNARSMKSLVPNSRITVRQSHATDAARWIVRSAAGGSSRSVELRETAAAASASPAAAGAAAAA
eukprot:5080734-Prymnesium_polylepis.1